MTDSTQEDLVVDLVRHMFQTYLDDASMESDGFIEGLDITHAQAAEFVNDVLLYHRSGRELPHRLKIITPLER